MRKLILFVLLILTNLYSYSQSISIQESKTFPKKIIIDTDTLVLITLSQVKQANLLFVDMDFYKEMSDTLRVLTSKQQKAIVAEHNLRLNYEHQLHLKKQIITGLDEVTASYKYTESRNGKQIRWLKFQRNTLAVGFGVALLKIFVFK